jgi:hypothetical protein
MPTKTTVVKAVKPSAEVSLIPKVPMPLAIKKVPNGSLSETEIDRLIKEHKGTVDDVLITPALAKYILKTYNTGNRKLRASHANEYAAILSQGKWMNTGEPLIFAAEGILNSGQHRLEAIARSNVEAMQDIRFGIPREAFARTDTGAKRQPGDVLSICGATTPFASAAAVKLLLAYERGLPQSYFIKFQNDQILAGYRRWSDIEDAIHFVTAHNNRKGFLNSASNSFAYMALRQTDKKTVGEFFEILDTGLAASKNDAPRLLRERLLSDLRLPGSTRTQSAIVERLALYIKAWNFWRKKEYPEYLRWRTNEKFPKMEVML